VTAKGLGGTDQTWERLARKDPYYWAILSDPAKRSGGWNESEFFASGANEAAALMQYIEGLAPGLARERALDFGCGVGRVTMPLAAHFARVTGVDVSPTMIEAARRYAGGDRRPAGACDYLVNTGTKLDDLDDASFDLVYSSFTLQHLPKAAALRYVAEFVRVLRPGGLVVFQLPARRRPSAKARAGGLVPRSLRAKRHSGIEMNGVLRGDVLAALALAGGEVRDIQRDSSAGPEWESYRYAAVKR